MYTSLVGDSLENYNKMPEQIFQKRNVAYKARISDILSGRFVKDDVSAGYVIIGSLNVYRVNVVAIFVFSFPVLKLNSVSMEVSFISILSESCFFALLIFTIAQKFILFTAFR